jgi:hypothetical protein
LLADRLVELGLVEHMSHVAVGARLKKTLENRGGSNRGVCPKRLPPLSPRWRTSWRSISARMIPSARRSVWMKRGKHCIARPQARSPVSLGSPCGRMMSRSALGRRAALSGWSRSRGGGRCG